MKMKSKYLNHWSVSTREMLSHFVLTEVSGQWTVQCQCAQDKSPDKSGPHCDNDLISR